MKITFEPIWFDSLGAKSSCAYVETPDIKLIIDPGVAALQPSFPASEEEKERWKEEGRRRIKRALERANLVVISHYHYDHYLREEPEIYRGKTLFIKDPNEYINRTQRIRAVKFIEGLVQFYSNLDIIDFFDHPKKRRFPDPLKNLSLATRRDYGDYTKRKRELTEKGRNWFKKLKEAWNKWPKVREIELKEIRLLFPEKKRFTFGNTTVRFTGPFFHGIEFSRVGWVFATIIEYREGGKLRKKLIHTSDLSGPVIEDYAQWIIDEDPDVLILDGPMTYMFGYMLNRINLNRAIENAVKIIKNTNTRLIIYDHHLPRERKFREHVKEVFNAAKMHNKRILTAAEYLGKIPKVLELN